MNVLSEIKSCFNRVIVNDTLAKNHRQLLVDKPGLRQREVANLLSISEAELVDAELSMQSIRLKPDVANIVKALPGLGYIMNLTRNNVAVHECKGCYQNVSIHGSMGLVISDDKKIDLRLFIKKWRYIFAVREEMVTGDRYSLQFFDQYGTAIQKIFLQPESYLEHYCQLLKNYRNDKQSTANEVLPSEPKKDRLLPDTIDADKLVSDWQKMKDVHQFVNLLKSHNVDRQQSFRLVGEQYAREFCPSELERILSTAADKGVPIMCFVGNSGSIQIFSGAINTVKVMGPWLNILDPEFNLHLLETGISEAWLVRKPTVDGIVTSLEFYDADATLVVQFFGKRQEHTKENPLWVQLAESVSDGVIYKVPTVAPIATA